MVQGKDLFFPPRDPDFKYLPAYRIRLTKSCEILTESEKKKNRVNLSIY